MAAVNLNKHTEIITRKVTLCGTKDIMFDRYAGDNNTKLEPWQKLYLEPGDSRVIGIPAANIMSFLSAHNTNSAPKRLRDKRKYKDIANACLSFVEIEQSFIPLTRNGSPIVFGRLEHDVDPLSGVYIHRSVARLDKGIPNPKERPVVPMDWATKKSRNRKSSTCWMKAGGRWGLEHSGGCMGNSSFRNGTEQPLHNLINV